jgi:hypothetical protein
VRPHDVPHGPLGVGPLAARGTLDEVGIDGLSVRGVHFVVYIGGHEQVDVSATLHLVIPYQASITTFRPVIDVVMTNGVASDCRVLHSLATGIILQPSAP